MTDRADFFKAFGDSTVHLMSRFGTPEQLTLEDLYQAIKDRLIVELVVSAPDLSTMGILQPSTPLQHPSTRPSSVEGGEANTCKLTECQGKPRCEKCLTMDRAYGMAPTASFLPCSFCNTADACKVSGCVDAKIGRAIAAGERAASGVGGRDE